MSLVKSPLFYYIKKFPRPFFVGFGLLFITNSLDALWPLALKAAIDQVEQQVAFGELAKTVMLYTAILFSLAWLRLGWRSTYGGFHTWAQEDLRQRLFTHVMGLSQRFFQKTPVGEVMSLLTNDVQSFRQGIGPGVLIVADAVMILCNVFPAMLYLHAGWTWKVLLLVPLVPLLIWRVMRLIHHYYKLQQDRFSYLTGICQETIGGIRVIKSFVQETNRLQFFNQASADFEKATNKMALVDALFVPVMEIGVASGSVILLFVAKDDILGGLVSIGTFVAFHRYIAKLVWPMTALGMGFSYIQKGRASYDRIENLLKEKSEIEDLGKIELQHFETLEFNNVSFKYPDADQYTLKNISFVLRRNEFLGITGPIGCGKSSLLQLIVRLYLPNEGQILVNGLPIETYTLESLRRVLVFVPSEPFLFSDSIRENIEFGLTHASDAQRDAGTIDKVVHSVCLKEEIESLPYQLESQLGERGINLSGGQKQRLTLARGLILPSEVILLDDVMSAVDVNTEARIEAVLKTTDKTRVLISHRFSSLKSANRIMVLKDGSIEAIGNWSELLGSSPTFKNLSEIQQESGR